MVDINDNFKPHGDGYLLSFAAFLVVICDTIHRSDASPAGKARARRVIDEVLKEARARRFQHTDMLETALLRPSNPRRLWKLCDSFVKHIGNDAFMATLERAGFRFRDGGQP